jgi:hypothetical protein
MSFASMFLRQKPYLEWENSGLSFFARKGKQVAVPEAFIQTEQEAPRLCALC